jgi:hypothetical protein
MVFNGTYHPASIAIKGVIELNSTTGNFEAKLIGVTQLVFVGSVAPDSVSL